MPQTLQDVVVIYVAVTGKQDGDLREENYVNKVYPQMIAGRLWSAIQVTTAAGITRGGGSGRATAAGVTPASCARKISGCTDVLQNRFGRHYAATGRQGNFRARRGQRSGRPPARPACA